MFGRVAGNQAGSAMTIVLVFATTALIGVSAFVLGQYAISRPTLVAPAKLQALLCARAGAWKGLESLNNPKQAVDTLKTINTLDSSFNKDLFGKPIPVKPDSSSDSIKALDGSPYSSDSFGTSIVTISPNTGYKQIKSIGTFRNIQKTVTVLIGGSCPLSPDTVCYLDNGLSPRPGIIMGGIKIAATAVPPSGVVKKDTLLHEEDIKKLIDQTKNELLTKGDTLMPGLPTLAQHAQDCIKLPEVIKGPLLLDGSRSAFSWQEKRRIYVLGDFQATGNISVENVELVVLGDVRLFDECKMNNVSVFCCKKAFVADRSEFQGTLIARSSMQVYGRAKINKNSILIVSAEKDSVSKSPGKKKYAFPMAFTEWASVYAVAISLKDELGIIIDKNVSAKGFYYSAGAMSINGTVLGIVKAKNLVDATLVTMGADDLKFNDNKLIGSIRKFPEIKFMQFPCFMGEKRVALWQEQ